MFKTETHAHVLPISTCSIMQPEEMVTAYKEKGYDTLFITDHLSLYHFNKQNNGFTYEQNVDLQYNSYLRAKKQGEELGITVLFGAELSLGNNHWLLYRENLIDFIKSRYLFDMTLEEFLSYAKQNGVTVIQAHPSREGGKYSPHPELVDGFEVINSQPKHKNDEELLFKLAKQYNLLMTVGSDAHDSLSIGGSAVLSDTPINSISDYLALLSSGKAKFMIWGKII